MTAIETGGSRETSDPAAPRSEEHGHQREIFEIEIETDPPGSTQTGRGVDPEMEVPLPLVRRRQIHSLDCLPSGAEGASCVAVEEAVEETGRQTEVEGGLPTTIAATATLEAALKRGAGVVNETSVTAVIDTPTPTSDVSLVTSAIVVNAT